MKLKKTLFVLLTLALSNAIIGCDNNNQNSSQQQSQSEQTHVDYKPIELANANYEVVSEDDYDRDLFYMNTLEFEVADPTVVYAKEGPGKGYFYAFGTSDLIQCHGIQCWRSDDLANWDYVGVALMPDPLTTWGFNNYWAPEVIYDETLKLYLMYYNADNINTGKKCISVAYSETPYGPYVCPSGFENQDGDMLSSSTPVVDFFAHADEIPSDIYIRRDAIDASPFIDPVTNKKYLYWSWYENAGQDIFGMEMKDWFTPDYSTVKQLTRLEHVKVTGDELINEGKNYVNEGPFMLYKDGTYFMTFSVYAYTNPNYQVRAAVADSPLGDFEKLSIEDGGVVLSTDPTWDYMQSAGHHCFITANDQIFIAYHTFYNRTDIQNGRALAVDEVFFVKNSKGQLTVHSNGPTYSLQPIPEAISGYGNVALNAKVTVEGDTSENVKLLTDNLIKFKYNDLATEYQVESGVAKITFEFDDFINLKAVMVYNSYLYDSSFLKINKIEMEYLADEDGNTNTAVINDVPFDWEFNADISSFSTIHPGASSIAEFEDIPVKKVTITINQKGLSFAISEIKILGATNGNVVAKNDFADTYTYSNEVNVKEYVNEGEVLGGTELFKATYGWDFSNDKKNDSSSYVTTSGIGDSFAYFKDVVTTQFYAEAYISTYAGKSFNQDQYPKFGMVVRNHQSCTFFYIDAANNYTSKQVGYTQSVYGDSGNWDWGATEHTTGCDIIYKNTELRFDTNYVKMSIIRVGAEFYFYINDTLVFTDDSLRGLGEEDLASVGFLGFNTPMVIKDYYITTDASEIQTYLDNLG